MLIMTLLANLMISFFLIGQMFVPVWAGQNNDKVIVYSRFGSIPDGVLEDFTKKTGIEVEHSTYRNNELLFTVTKLLKGRGYDVLVSSTDMIDRMHNEGLIQPIEHGKLVNFKQLDPNLLNKAYDPGNEFSMPFLWGTTGIGIDTSKVDISKITSWKDLWHRQWRGKLSLMHDIRETFHIALKVDGHSLHTKDPEEIKQAYERLRDLKPNTKVNSPTSGNDVVNLGILYNSKAIKIQAERPSFQYIYPQEGANFWMDSFVIPARSPHIENAYKFIDYMLSQEVAARSVEEVGYATSNLAAKRLLDKSLQNNSMLFAPLEALSKAVFEKDIGHVEEELYYLYWRKLKPGI